MYEAVLRFQASLCWDYPCKEWTSFVSCLAFSTDNKYNSSTLVGLKHPVIARHALLSSESS